MRVHGRRPVTAGPRVRFAIIAAVAGSLMLGLGLTAPLIPVLSNEFGMSPRFIGVLLAAFPVGRLLSSYPGGWASDHFGFRNVGVAACGAATVAALAAAVLFSPAAMLAGLFVMGGASAVYAAGGAAYVLENAERDRVGRVMSLYQTLALLGMSFGPAVGAVTATRIDIRAPFVVFALLTAIGIVVTRWIVPAPAPAVAEVAASARAPGGGDESDSGEHSLARGRRRVFGLLGLAAVTLFWIRSGPIITLTPIFASEQMGLDVETIGYALTLGLAMTVIVVPHAGRLADRGHSRRLLLLFTAVLAACMGLLFVSSEAWHLFVVLAVCGMCAGYLLVAPQILLLTWSPEGRVGRTIGAHRTASSFGLVIGALTTGEIVELGLVREGYLIGALLLVAGGLAMLAMPRGVRPAAAEPRAATA